MKANNKTPPGGTKQNKPQQTQIPQLKSKPKPNQTKVGCYCDHSKVPGDSME